MEYAKTVILLVCMCASIQGYVHKAETMREVLPAYAMATVTDQLNSTRCRTEMKEFRDAVDRGVLWGLRMLDSSGQPTSGFIAGNNYWMGHKRQCKYISENISFPLEEKTIRNNSIYRNPAEEFPPFQLNFFGAHFVQNSILQYHAALSIEDVMVLGLCLPASCSEHEVETMLKKVFDNRLLLFGQLYSTDFRLIRVSNMINDYKWLLSGKIMTILFILGALFAIVTAGTLYDIFVYQKRLRKQKELIASENDTFDLKNDVEEKREYNPENDVPSEMKLDNRITQILICFSVYSNMKQIFTTDNKAEEITVFHGMKFFGMMWIIILHSFYFLSNVVGNKGEMHIMSMAVMYQVVTNGTLAVDTFFFIGGFLMTLGHLKGRGNENKIIPLRRNVMIFINAIIKRYIRLTPSYLIMILLVIVNFSWYEQFAMSYFAEPVHELCSKYWWRNILYISNFFGWENLCMTWSWYLPNDMQFFIFGSFVLIFLRSNYYAVFGVPAAALLLCTFMRAYVAYDVEYIPTLDMEMKLFSKLYILPWMRIQPYIIGMATAALLRKLNYKLHLSKKTLVACWCFSIFCICSILFGLYDRKISLHLSILYTMFSRLGWSFATGWFVIACVTNNAGIVGKFLSLKCWVPLDKVMLCAYLLNPFLIMTIGMFSMYPLYIDLFTTIALSLGMTVLTFICAFVLSATVEVPAISLLQLHINSNRGVK